MLRAIQAVFARGVSERLRRLIEEPHDCSLDTMLQQKAAQRAGEPAPTRKRGSALRERLVVSA